VPCIVIPFLLFCHYPGCWIGKIRLIPSDFDMMTQIDNVTSLSVQAFTHSSSHSLGLLVIWNDPRRVHYTLVNGACRSIMRWQMRVSSWWWYDHTSCNMHNRISPRRGSWKSSRQPKPRVKVRTGRPHVECHGSCQSKGKWWNSRTRES
jgi:hypothetical protein